MSSGFTKNSIDASIDGLVYYSRFNVIAVPLNSSFRFAKHWAILDCKEKMILEGVNDVNTGYLSIQTHSLHNHETIDIYIKYREKLSKTKFHRQDDIEFTQLDTKQNAESRWRKSYESEHGDLVRISYMVNCFFAGGASDIGRFEKYKPWEKMPGICENDIERRFTKMMDIPERTYKYDFSGTKGWNCESVVSYIVVGEPYAHQGAEYAYLKELGILDRHGKLFGSIS